MHAMSGASCFDNENELLESNMQAMSQGLAQMLTGESSNATLNMSGGKNYVKNQWQQQINQCDFGSGHVGASQAKALPLLSLQNQTVFEGGVPSPYAATGFDPLVMQPNATACWSKVPVPDPELARARSVAEPPQWQESRLQAPAPTAMMPSTDSGKLTNLLIKGIENSPGQLESNTLLYFALQKKNIQRNRGARNCIPILMQESNSLEDEHIDMNNPTFVLSKLGLDHDLGERNIIMRIFGEFREIYYSLQDEFPNGPADDGPVFNLIPNTKTMNIKTHLKQVHRTSVRFICEKERIMNAYKLRNRSLYEMCQRSTYKMRQLLSQMPKFKEVNFEHRQMKCLHADAVDLLKMLKQLNYEICESNFFVSLFTWSINESETVTAEYIALHVGTTHVGDEIQYNFNGGNDDGHGGAAAGCHIPIQRRRMQVRNHGH